MLPFLMNQRFPGTFVSYAKGGSNWQINKNLVVIGNGMAGARTVEEILARGGGEQFRDHHVRR